MCKIVELNTVWKTAATWQNMEKVKTFWLHFVLMYVLTLNHVKNKTLTAA